MRDTAYAEELCEPGIIQFDDSNQGRIERLFVKDSGEEEVRFSWWKNGNMTTRPLDLSEEHLIALFSDALHKGVFTTRFRSRLRDLL